MKITSALALKYLRKNKRKSISVISGITIVTILIVSILLLLSTYQSYMVNIQRERKNWEIEFKSIKYSDALEIEKDENVKEISIVKELGIGDENFGDETINTRVLVKAYDENALKNLGITIDEGRIPKNDKEVVKTYNINLYNEGQAIDIGDTFEITLNETRMQYTITGIASGMSDLTGVKNGYLQGAAITYLDRSNLKENDIVDITVITNNIKDVYKTGERLSGFLYDTDEERINNVAYNTELLNYAGVIGENNTFTKNIVVIAIFLILLITISAIIMIYTSFKITYSERIRELGVLSSIGMDKSHRKKMILKESTILGAIGIILGLILGIFLSYFITKLLNILINQIIYNDIIKTSNEIFPIINGVELKLVIPYTLIILSVIIVYAIVYMSAIMSTRKINNITQLEAIRNNKNSSIKVRKLKTPKIVKILFKEEGELAYKNIKRDSTKYKTIVASICISVVLFLTVSGFISNLNLEKDNSVEDYIISTSYGKANEISKYLLDNNYIEDYYYYTVLPRYALIKQEDISKELKEMSESGLNVLTINDEQNITVLVYSISDNKYKGILQNLELEELKENECILVNSITNNQKTKYGKNIPITNYKENDKLILSTNEMENNELTENEEIENIINNLDKITNEKENTRQIDYKNNTYEFNIVKVVDNITPYIELDNSNFLAILVSSNTFDNMIRNEEKNVVTTEIKIMKKNILEEKENEIKAKFGENITISNIYEGRISASSEERIKEVILYSFVGLIAILSIINIFNIISSSIILRKREFAILKSIGMSKRKINKMLFLEGIFYGLRALIYGIIISTIILFIMYLFMIETKLYNFSISWINILYSCIATYLVIFIAIEHSKNKIVNKNIIDDIKNENI